MVFLRAEGLVTRNHKKQKIQREKVKEVPRAKGKTAKKIPSVS